MGDELFYNCKFGVLQYVLIIPVCAIVTFVTIAAGAYEGPAWYVSVSIQSVCGYVFLFFLFF